MSTIDTQDLSQEDLQKAVELEDLYEDMREYDALEAARAEAERSPTVEEPTTTKEESAPAQVMECAPQPPAALLRGMGYNPNENFQTAEEIEEEKDTVLYSLPPLPLDCLSPQVREIVEGIAIAENVDTWIPFSVLLKSVCACVGASVLLKQKIKTGYKYNPAHMWLVLAAQSGGGKSDVNRYIFDVIENAQYAQHKKYKEEVGQYKKDMVKYESALAASSKDKSITVPEEPKKPFSINYYVNDITEESLIVKFMHNPQGMLWNSDEFSSWLKSMDRYKSSDSGQKARMLGFYSGEGFLYDRVKNENITESVKRAWLSLYGTIQPDILGKSFTEDDFENGFLQRMTFIFAQELEETDPDYEDDEIFSDYDPAPTVQIFQTMLSWPRLTPEGGESAKIAELEPESSKILRKYFYESYKKYSTFGTLFEKTRAKRWRAQVSRLILILHCLERAVQGAPDGGGVVSPKTVERGIKIFEALTEHAIEAERRIKKHLRGKGQKEEPFTISNLDFVKHIKDLFEFRNDQAHFDYNGKIDRIKKIDMLKRRLAGGETAITTQKITRNLEGLGFVKTQISSGVRMMVSETKFEKLLAAAEKWETDKRNRQGGAIVPF